MNKSFTFRLQPSESLYTHNTRLSLYSKEDYEKGSLEGHKVKSIHELTFKIKESRLKLVSLPESKQTWYSGKFPNNIRLVSNFPIRSSNFPFDSFYLNGTQLGSWSVLLDSDYSFSVNLTGTNTGLITAGTNKLSVSNNIYTLNNNSINGVLWLGNNDGAVYPRNVDEDFYRAQSGSLRIERIALPQNVLLKDELNRFANKRRVEILDYVWIENNPLSTCSGWIYILYCDKDTFEIIDISPNRIDISNHTGQNVYVEFAQPVDKQYTGTLTGRIFITPHDSNTLTNPASISWSEDRRLLIINPNSSCKQEGHHQVYINLLGISSEDGQLLRTNPYVWSSYYIHTGRVATGSGGSVSITGAPDDAAYLTVALNATLTNERVITEGDYIKFGDAGAGSTFTVSLDTGQVTGFLTAWTTFTGHTGDTSLHGGPGGGAPTTSTYVVISADGSLSNERILTGGTYITITDGGANAEATVDVNTTALSATFTTSASFLGLSGTFTGHTGIQFTALSGAFTGSQALPYVTIGNTSSLSNERALTGSTYIDVTDGGANSTVTVSVNTTQLSTAYVPTATFTALSGSYTGHTGNTFTVLSGVLTGHIGNAFTLLSGSYTGHTGGAFTALSGAFTGYTGSSSSAALSGAFTGHTGIAFAALSGLIIASEFICVNIDASLPAARSIRPGAYLAVTDDGPGGNYNINVDGVALAVDFVTLPSFTGFTGNTFRLLSGAFTGHTGGRFTTLSGIVTGLQSLAYVTIGNTASLANERALTAGTYINVTDGGANNSVTVELNRTATDPLYVLTDAIQRSGDLIVGTGKSVYTSIPTGTAHYNVLITNTGVNTGLSWSPMSGRYVNIEDNVYFNKAASATGMFYSTTVEGALNELGGILKSATVFRIKDDFVGSATEDGEIGELGWAKGTLGTTTQPAGTVMDFNHPGVLTMNSPNSGMVIWRLLNTTLKLSGNSIISQEWVFRPGQITQKQTIEIGYMSNIGTTGVSGIYFHADTDTGSTWGAVCKRSSTVVSRIELAPGLTVDTGWHYARIDIMENCSGVNFYIRNTGSAASGTITSSIPLGTTSHGPGLQLDSKTGGALTLHVDYFSMYYTGINRTALTYS